MPSFLPDVPADLTVDQHASGIISPGSSQVAGLIRTFRPGKCAVPENISVFLTLRCGRRRHISENRSCLFLFAGLCCRILRSLLFPVIQRDELAVLKIGCRAAEDKIDRSGNPAVLVVLPAVDPGAVFKRSSETSRLQLF